MRKKIFPIFSTENKIKKTIKYHKIIKEYIKIFNRLISYKIRDIND